MKTLTVAAALLSVVLTGSQLRSYGPDHGDGVIVVAPVLQIPRASQKDIEIDLRNVSQKPIKYLLSNVECVYPLAFLLYRDGKLIEPREVERPPVLAEDRVRELDPGRSVRHTLNLRERYGELQPGHYVLQAHIKTTGGPFGLTQMSLRRTVLFLELK